MEEPRRRIKRLVVLASGHGTNLQAVIDACATGCLEGVAAVAAVVSNRPAQALQRANAVGIPSVLVTPHGDEDRADYDARLADVVAGFDPDLVVLAGWMRILSTSFLGWFPDRVINLHPALPGELPGTGAIGRAWHEALAGERTLSGVMVHLVPDEGVDTGPALTVREVPILPDDTLETFESRIHDAEHAALVATIHDICTTDRLRHPTEIPA